MAILGGLGRIARLLVSIDADTKGLERSLDSAEAKVKSFAAKVEKRIDTRAFLAVGAAITGVGVGLGGLLVTTGLYAARVEVLKTSMEVVGKTAGYTTDFLAEQEEKIKDLGITTKASREILVLLMQSEIDLAEATDLCRTAQDLAVISGENSSETARNLAYAIATGNPMLLRRYGIMENLSDIQKEYGKDLTSVQIKEAILNMIRKKGATVAGVYEKAMGDVGKKLTSLPRLIDDAKLAFGQAFIPVIGLAVDKLSELLKIFTDLSPETKELITKIVMFAAGLALIVGPILTLIGLLPTLIAGFGVLLGPVGLVTAAVTTLIATIGILVWKHWDEIKAKVTETIQAIVSRFGEWDNVIAYFRKFIKDKVIPTIEKFMEKGKDLAFKLVEVGVKIYNKFSDILPSLIGLIETVVGWFEKFWDKGGELADKLAEAGKKIGDKFIDMLPDLVDTIEDDVIPAFENLAKKIGPIIEKGIEFMGLLAETAIDWLPKIVDKIGDLVEWLAKLDPRWLEIILGIIGFAVALKTASIIVGKISAIFVKLWGIIKWFLKPILLITALWGKLGAIINWVIGIGESLYIVLLGLSAPVGVVIAAIILLIGTILLWVKYGEASRKKTREIWGAIWNFLENLWITIGEKAVEIWNSVRDFFVDLWESIKIKVVETWNSIKDFFVNLWEDIKQSLKDTWNTIVNWIREKWEEIKNILITAGKDIWAWMLDWIPFLNLYVEALEWSKELTRQILGKIKDFFMEIWNTIKDFCIETWNTIKDFCIETWNIVKDFFIETWNIIKEKAIEIWTSISDFFIEAWNKIKEIFETALNWVEDIITTVFNWLKDSLIIPLWNSIVDFFKNTWNDIMTAVNTFKNNFLKVWDKIKEGLKKPINGMISLINDLLSRVESGMNNMISALNRIGFKVPDWFAEIMPGLAGREFKISISKISIPKIPKLQLGGYISEPGFVDVGERGRERIFLPGGAKVVPLERGQRVVKYVIGNVNIADTLMKSEEFIKSLVRQMLIQQGKEILD